MFTRILAIIIGIALLAGAIAYAVLNAPERDEPAPAPQVTVTAEPAPSPDTHDHDHDIPAGLDDAAVCDLETDSCDGQIQDFAGIDPATWQSLAVDVARAHLQVTAGESSEARTARVEAAGADSAVARSMPEVSRASSGKPGLTATTSVTEVLSVMPVTADEQGVRYLIGVNVAASYRLPSGQGTDHTLGGRVDVWVDASTGKVTRIAEHFPQLDRLG